MDPRIRRISPVLLLLAGAGCYTYTPATLPELRPGETVRTLLSREQIVDLDGIVTISGRQLTGRVVGLTEGRVLIDVPVAGSVGGSPIRTLNQRVALAPEGILEVERRNLDGVRTALVVGGAVAVVGALVAWQISESENSPVRNPREPPDASRVPGVRIVIPLPGGP